MSQLDAAAVASRNCSLCGGSGGYGGQRHQLEDGSWIIPQEYTFCRCPLGRARAAESERDWAPVREQMRQSVERMFARMRSREAEVEQDRQQTDPAHAKESHGVRSWTRGLDAEGRLPLPALLLQRWAAGEEPQVEVIQREDGVVELRPAAEVKTL